MGQQRAVLKGGGAHVEKELHSAAWLGRTLPAARPALYFSGSTDSLCDISASGLGYAAQLQPLPTSPQFKCTCGLVLSPRSPDTVRSADELMDLATTWQVCSVLSDSVVTNPCGSLPKMRKRSTWICDSGFIFVLDFLLQGEPFYANETVHPGDLLLRVDGGEVAANAGGDLADLLLGAELTPTHLVLRRWNSGRVYGVRSCTSMISLKGSFKF